MNELKNRPKEWDAAHYSIRAAPAQHLLQDSNVIEPAVGNRAFEVHCLL